MEKGTRTPLRLAGAREHAASGVMSTLPVLLPALFALVPSVSARLFSTFSCEPFLEDDKAGATRFFLVSDRCRA